ncbi:hypothetical protein PVK06_043504 [Gossypium arboreum]|uniref:Uncharacterized protein n=1 Tax=Gossypium arboreum TaxID=29729 RepID=A0ABR0MNW6_GOSAR|nr:hypothetical protein PVK06_043504 [Gossypium arboreum]
MPVWTHTPRLVLTVRLHGLAQDPHTHVAYMPNLAMPVWPTRPHSSHTHGRVLRTAMPSSSTRLCLTHGHPYG